MFCIRLSQSASLRLSDTFAHPGKVDRPILNVLVCGRWRYINKRANDFDEEGTCCAQDDYRISVAATGRC